MSTIKVNTIQNQAGVEVYTAKAWVNFNGTGTVAIRAAGNVTSITDNGTGDYTVNFTTALSDANYSWAGSAATPGTSIGIVASRTVAPTTSSLRLASYNTSNNPEDNSYVNVSVFR